MDGAFLDLNSLQIKDDIDEFSKEMVQLQKLFKSKFKQAALDGESKYSKMNLEDSDPNQLPPPLKICALTIAAIDTFTENIRVISCLCNPGIRLRHWNQMSAIIGFDITPNSGSSLRCCASSPAPAPAPAPFPQEGVEAEPGCLHGQAGGGVGVRHQGACTGDLPPRDDPPGERGAAGH